MALIVRSLLGGLAGLLLLSQYTTMVKFQPLSASVSYLHVGSYLHAIGDLVPLGPADGLLFGLIGIACIAVVLLEVRGAHLSLFLRSVFASEGATLGLLLASSFVFVRYYISPGDFNWAADSSQHIAYADITARAMAAGDLPFWTWYLGTGSPYLQFYGFVFFWLVGLVNLLVGDTYSSIKFVLLVCHVLSGAGAYAAARAGGCRRGAAFVAGMGFVLCFWHAQHVLIMGRLQLSVVYALLPWPFWAVDSALRCARPKTGIAVALLGGTLLGLLVLAHPGFGYWACAFVALYSLTRLALDRRLAAACLPALTVATGLVVGAALVLPMWIDKRFTGLGEGNFSLAGMPDPHWWNVLVWSNFRFWLWPPAASEFNWYGGYLGLSLVVLAGIAAVQCVRWRGARASAPVISALVCLVGGLVMVFAYRSALVRLLPNYEILASGRYLLYVSFFLALSAGHGVRLLQARRRTIGHGGRRVVAVAILLIVADLGPTTFQHLFRSSQTSVDSAGIASEFFEGFRARARDFEQQGLLPNYRAFWARPDLLAPGLFYYSTTTPSPDGPHPGELPAVFRFVRPFERLVDVSTASRLTTSAGQLDVDATIYAGLSLLNARFLLSRSTAGQALGLELPHPSPIHVSSRLSPPPAPSAAALTRMLQLNLDELLAAGDPRDVAGMTQVITWLEGMQVDARSGACHTFFVDQLSTSVDLGTDPGVRVLKHEVRTDRVDLQVEVAARSFARLAYGYYPHIRVLVDGQAVQTRSTSDGFTLIKLEAGRRNIQLQSRLSPLRSVLLWLSLLVVLGSVIAYVGRRRWGQV